ncbi:MAG: T9SS type A sorting domain-containing protein [Vicingaceae bacterium]
MKLTPKNTLFFIVCLCAFPHLLNAQLNGAYTIDAATATQGSNFNSFTDLTTALENQGVSGPVNVSVVPGSGPYNEKLVFNYYAGVSSNNQIVIQGNGEQLQYAPNANDYRIVGFDSARHIVLDSLTINGLHPLYGYAIHLKNKTKYITIQNCTIDLSNLSTSPTTLPNSSTDTKVQSAGIIASASDTSAPLTNIETTSFTTIKNNRILGSASGSANAGIMLVGENGRNSYGNLIEDNYIRNFHSTGIYFAYQQRIIIRRNELTSPERNDLAWEVSGIYCFGGAMDSIVIESNYVHHLQRPGNFIIGRVNGIRVYGRSSSISWPILVQNNIIDSLRIGWGTCAGIYNTNSEFVHVIHNTVRLNPGKDKTRGIIMTGHFGNASHKILNNIVQIHGDPFNNYSIGIHVGFQNNTECRNNNVYFNTSGNQNLNRYGEIGNTNFATLAAWQSHTFPSVGQGSSDNDPQITNIFTSPRAPQLNNSGRSYPLAYDYYYLPRGNRSDLGAIRFDTSIISYYPIDSLNKVNQTGLLTNDGLKLKTSGVVIGTAYSEGMSSHHFLVNGASTNHSGIALVSKPNVSLALSEGDSIQLYGVLKQSNGLTEIEVDSFTVLSTNAMLPSPTLVNRLDETIESNFVQLNNLHVISNSSNVGNYTFQAVKGPDTLMISIKMETDVDDSLAIAPLLAGDTLCSIAGMVTQNDTLAPFLEHYALIPMRFSSLDTLSCQLTNLDETSVEPTYFNLYPNPANDRVYLSTNVESPIELMILDLNGRLLKRITNYKKKEAIDLSSFSDGIYLMKLSSKKLKQQFKFIKY